MRVEKILLCPCRDDVAEKALAKAPDKETFRMKAPGLGMEMIRMNTAAQESIIP